MGRRPRLFTDISIAVSCLVFLVATLSCAAPPRELVILTYDSFVSEYGPGPKLAELFEKQSGIKVTWKAKGDGGQLLADLALGAKDGLTTKGADLALGLDNFLEPRALALDLFQTYKPKDLGKVPAELRIDPSNRLIPYDYGWFAIIYDSAKAKKLPTSLDELASPAFKGQLILMDPRSSTPGLGFLAWTRSVYGTNWEDYWKRLAPSVLAMPAGWDAGYGLFLAGEAPFVLSYTTSPAYHKEVEGSDRYKVLPLPEGNPRQVELAGILKGGPHRRAAELFMDFIISPEAQALLPTTQWMYPVRPEVALPAGFSAALKPAKSLEPSTEGLFEAAPRAVELVGARARQP